MLTCIILLPLLAALVIVAIPARYRFLIRSIALGTTLGTLLLATSVFLGFEGAEAGGYPLYSAYPGILLTLLWFPVPP